MSGNEIIRYAQLYEGGDVRKVAHGIKNLLSEEIVLAATEMAQYIPSDSVLIPIPSSCGFAKNALLLAQVIADIKGVKVLDVLYGQPRESQYYAKKQGTPLTAQDMSMKIKEGVEVPENAVLIDNVAATGETVRAARMALGHDALAVVYAIEPALTLRLKETLIQPVKTLSRKPR